MKGRLKKTAILIMAAIMMVTGSWAMMPGASIVAYAEKATPYPVNFIFTAPSSLTADGTAHSASVTPAEGITGMGTITVKYSTSNAEASTWTEDAPTAAGTYYVRISVTEGDNYLAAEDLGDETWTFTLTAKKEENTTTESTDETDDQDSLIKQMILNQLISASAESQAAATAQTAVDAYNDAYKATEATISKETSIILSELASKPVPVYTNYDAINITGLTTAQGLISIINQAAAHNGDYVVNGYRSYDNVTVYDVSKLINLYSDEPISMNQSVLDAIQKTGRSLVYTFKYNGTTYRITIPAGKADTIDRNGQDFVGPLEIGRQLGTTQTYKMNKDTGIGVWE